MIIHDGNPVERNDGFLNTAQVLVAVFYVGVLVELFKARSHFTLWPMFVWKSVFYHDYMHYYYYYFIVII